MNRRNFIVTSTAGLALFSRRALAQRSAVATTVAISEFNGAEIDYTASSFTLSDQNYLPTAGETISFGWEQFKFVTGGGELTFDLFTTGSQDFPQFMLEYKETFGMLFESEEFAFADVDDGGYSAFSFDTSMCYMEYQFGAFPDVDFMVTLITDQATFQDEFAKLQSIMVGGAPPCIFTAESGVESIEFAQAEPTAVASTRISRTANSSQTSQSNTSTNTAVSDNESVYVDAVITHRGDFLASYDEFDGHLTTVGEPTTTDEDKSTLFDQMYDIALGWKDYPTDAAALVVPAGMESLGSVYADWAAVIGEMGTLFEELYMGTDTIDAFIEALTEWEMVDAKLKVELEAYGYKGDHHSATLARSIQSGLELTWKSFR